MYMDILRTITGIEVFPVISLVLFTTVFSVVLIWAWRADRTRLDRLAAIPLDEPAGSAPAVGLEARALVSGGDRDS